MLHASWSDAPSWRKQDASNNSLKLKVRGEEEVTSPEKNKKDTKESDAKKTRRVLDLGKEVEVQKEGASATMPSDVNSSMQAIYMENQTGLEGRTRVGEERKR
jgi:hypothetical protein